MLLIGATAAAHPHGAARCATRLAFDAGAPVQATQQLVLDRLTSDLLARRLELAEAAPSVAALAARAAMISLFRRHGWLLEVRRDDGLPGAEQVTWSPAEEGVAWSLDEEGAVQVAWTLVPDARPAPAGRWLVRCVDAEWYWQAHAVAATWLQVSPAACRILSSSAGAPPGSATPAFAAPLIERPFAALPVTDVPRAQIDCAPVTP